MNENGHGYAEVNNTRLYYEIKGQGDPLVLIHGMNLNHTMWNTQVPEFSKHYKVIRYDLRGYGKSANPKEGESYSNHTDLKTLLDLLNIKKTHLLGLSMGGMICQEFALRYPERLDKLVLTGTGASNSLTMFSTLPAINFILLTPFICALISASFTADSTISMPMTDFTWLDT